MDLSPRIKEMLGPADAGHVVTDDGVTLGYQSFGDGPAFVFANGIGVSHPGLAYQIAALRPRHRVVCWDYRGVAASALPAAADVSIPRHARDVLTVLDHLGVDRAVFVGWSMGVQVALEVARVAPGRVNGFVSLLGAYGQPFRTAFPTAVAQQAEGMFGLMYRFAGAAQGMLDVAVALPTTAFRLLSTLMFVGADADQEVFAANVRSVASADRRAYLRTMLAMADHDASDVLAGLGCPAMIICGERDHLTPPAVARRMAETIADAVYHEIAQGTHFALIEQPERVNQLLVEFGERVYNGG